MGSASRGQRLPDASIWAPVELSDDVPIGAYWKVDRGAVGLIENASAWVARFPDGRFFTINTGVQGHPVTEHDDGTISVGCALTTGTWSGWITRGTWVTE